MSGRSGKARPRSRAAAATTLIRLGNTSVLLPPISSSLASSQTTFFNSGRYQINNRVLRLGITATNTATNVSSSTSSSRSTGESPTHRVTMMSPTKPRVTSQSAEFATRFAQRPCTRPKVIGLDSETMIPRSKGSKGASRGIGGFFPPVKLRMAPEPYIPSGSAISRSQKSPALLLELAPEQQYQQSNVSPDHWSTRTAPAASHVRHFSTNSQISSHSAQTAVPSKVYPHLHESKHGSVDALTDLPHPKMVVSRDTPWVYRYKVKKNMNELSKIMASKSPPVTETPSSATIIHG